MKPKLLRITTVPQSLGGLLKGQLRFMNENGFEVIGISAPGERLQLVEKEEGVKTYSVVMTRRITLVQDIKAVFKLIRIFKKEKPAIVHTHTPKAGIVGMLAAKIAGVPHRLHTVAGMPLTVATGNKRKLLNMVEKMTYACATKVYPNSYGLQDIILENKFTKPKKLKVIGYGSSNGIDTSQFDPEKVSVEVKADLRKELIIKDTDFVFLFVGRVVTDKGVNELVQAFDSLSQSYQNAQLVIVGSHESHLDPLHDDVEKLIQNNPFIHAVGYKTNVEEYFAMADVLTFPSYREGFPNVVMQAASMQLNAIVSDINGCNEIITNGKNGWIVPSQNVEQLKERMLWCLNHPEESKSMGLKSRMLMQKKYERRFVWEELLKEYESLLAER